MKKNQKGQALIELIFFLPIMFMVYSIINGFANAINGSINQQKVTRSYFYFRSQNNSMMPKPQTVQQGWRYFGMAMTGWRQFSDEEGGNPTMPCYRITVPMGRGTNDPPCGNPYTESSTMLMRVGTVYGICGATFGPNGGIRALLPDMLGMDYRNITNINSCTIQ